MAASTACPPLHAPAALRPCHAQIQVDEGVVAVATSAASAERRPPPRSVRRREREYARTAGGEHLFALFVAHCQHGVASLRQSAFMSLPPCARVDQVAGVEDDEVHIGRNRLSFRLESADRLIAQRRRGLRRGDGAPSFAVTGNTAFICPVPEAPK